MLICYFLYTFSLCLCCPQFGHTMPCLCITVHVFSLLLHCCLLNTLHVISILCLTVTLLCLAVPLPIHTRLHCSLAPHLNSMLFHSASVPSYSAAKPCRAKQFHCCSFLCLSNAVSCFTKLSHSLSPSHYSSCSSSSKSSVYTFICRTFSVKMRQGTILNTTYPSLTNLSSSKTSVTLTRTKFPVSLYSRQGQDRAYEGCP